MLDGVKLAALKRTAEKPMSPPSVPAEDNKKSGCIVPNKPDSPRILMKCGHRMCVDKSLATGETYSLIPGEVYGEFKYFCTSCKDYVAIGMLHCRIV